MNLQLSLLDKCALINRGDYDVLKVPNQINPLAKERSTFFGLVTSEQLLGSIC